MNLIAETFNQVVGSSLSIVIAYIPRLFAGILIFAIGIVVASLMRDVVKIAFKYFRFDRILESSGVTRGQDVTIWPNILSELVRWATIFVFLMSSVEIWGIPKVADVLGQLLQFLPNVFLAVIIGWIGLVVGRFTYDIVRHGVRGLGGQEAVVLGTVARYSIIFFTTLIILTQLGVAADLVRILFTGIVGMLALAIGLSFGLGGQDEARRILSRFREKVQSAPNIKGTRKKK
jgi:hypothetical protein